jgi:hypothetical protein
MSKMIETWGGRIVVIVILAAGIFVFSQLPAAQDYRSGADEGTYYGYGRQILDHGFAGFANLAREFSATPAAAHPPNPLRLGTVLTSALALCIHDGYDSLSMISLLSFLLLLACGWRFLAHDFNRPLALVTVILLAVSPLQLAMARRALMDSLAATTAALSFFLLLRLLESATPRRVAAFVLMFTFAVLVKETALLLLPFYAAILLYPMLCERTFARLPQVAAALCLPPILAGLAYLGAYGMDAVIEILKLLPERSVYDAVWEQGPWYRYLFDYLMLSPLVLLLGVAGAGDALLHARDRRLLPWLGLAVYMLFVYAPLTKNVRYCLLLDVPIRLFAAAMVLALAYRLRARIRRHRAVQTWAEKMLTRWIHAAFQRYFIAAGIYDPISYNLLETNHSVPRMRLLETAPEAAPAAANSGALITARARVVAQPDATGLLALGYEYCAAGLPLECSWASREAVRLAPANARAFNNLCAAYNGLGDWSRAIEACREALRLDPTLALARNNLAWAESQAAKFSAMR